MYLSSLISDYTLAHDFRSIKNFFGKQCEGIMQPVKSIGLVSTLGQNGCYLCNHRGAEIAAWPWWVGLFLLPAAAQLEELPPWPNGEWQQIGSRQLDADTPWPLELTFVLIGSQHLAPFVEFLQVWFRKKFRPAGMAS